MLKSLSRIAEAIRHVEIFVKAKRSDDSCFRDVRGKNRYLIGLYQIQFGEDGSAMETGCQVLEIRKRVAAGLGTPFFSVLFRSFPCGRLRSFPF